MSLAVQAAHLDRRYPDGRIVLRANRLTWLGHLKPTDISRAYEVLAVIEPGWAPLIYVVDPPLQRRDDEPVPHVYSANDLCLYTGDEWNDTMIVADTLIPWTSEWLFFYETWHATGDWLGGGPPIVTAHRRNQAGLRTVGGHRLAHPDQQSTIGPTGPTRTRVTALSRAQHRAASAETC